MGQRRLQSAVIGEVDGDMTAALALLGQRLNQSIDYLHFPTPLEVDGETRYDFMVIGEVDHLRKTVERLQRNASEVPLIIHLYFSPKPLKINYDEAFPGVPIIPFRQAPLEAMDETLQIDVFEQIITRLVAMTW